MKKSKLGYKRYSPDVNNPYNIIPSGRITMRDVDFPVYGVDEYGNAQMMYPGGEYQFPGNQVFELPIAQAGITVPKPYIRPDFFTREQVEAARDAQARKFATPATGRIEGEGLIDVVLPVVAAPIVKAVAKPLMAIVGDAASYATTQTPLRNAWRLNPKAYQYNLPENTMWRGLGQEGMEDAVSSGLFRAKQNVPVEYFPGSTLRASKSFGTNPYFTPKFKTAAEYGDNFIAEVPKGAANWSQRYKRSDWSQVANRPIPIEEGRILQKDWLRGYKPLDISKQTGGEQLPMAQLGGMRRGKVDRILNENRDLNFVQRMYQPDTPSIMIPGQDGPSTHFMESADSFVYPTVVQMPDGNLQYLGEGAYDHAMQTGEYIQFPNDRQARRFAKSYKKGTGVLEEYGKGGLTQWFAEKWVDVKTGEECGRSGKDKDGRPYPACRPSKRVNETTPKTTSEMSSSEKAKFKREKTSGKRIDYNHSRKEYGGQQIDPLMRLKYQFGGANTAAFYPLMQGLKAGMYLGNTIRDWFSSDESPAPMAVAPSAPKEVDWRKMSRPEQIDYGIQQTIQYDAPERRKDVENLLEATAYMENTYGANPNAYGRTYTNSFMSIDPIALTDMFKGRGNNGAYTSAQQRYLDSMRSMGLPTEQKQFQKLLRQDDPRAAMMAARARYTLVPEALPAYNDKEGMFNYWLKYYNGNGVLKHKTRAQAYKDFEKAYAHALRND